MMGSHVFPELVHSGESFAAVGLPTSGHALVRVPPQVGPQVARLLVLLAAARMMAGVHQLLARLVAARYLGIGRQAAIALQQQTIGTIAAGSARIPAGQAAACGRRCSVCG